MGNFCPDRIALPGAFNPQIQTTRAILIGVGNLFDTPSPSSPQTGSWRQQIADQNPWMEDHLQVAPGFHICYATNAAEEEGVDIPSTYI